MSDSRVLVKIADPGLNSSTTVTFMDFKLPTVPSPQACFSRGGQFPQEIFAEFAEYLTVKCLLDLSLTSSSLRKEAQRVLFRV